MAKEKDELWAGGSWEQPTSRYTLPDPPNAQLGEQVKLSRSFRRWRRRGAGLFRRGIAILATGAVLAGIVAVAVSHPASPLYIQPYTGWTESTIPSGGGSAGGSYGGGTYVESETDSTMSAPSMVQADLLTSDLITIEEGEGEVLTPQEIYQNNEATVVYIESYSMEGIGAGTGIILSEDGYIVTNAHVIAGAMETTVTLWDESIYTATLVGWDGDEDLAVIKIDAQGLTPAVFGDSDDLQVGDNAYAIGNPLGAEYRSTFTDGIISALGRYLDIDGVYMSLIQTTTPINMGNSGGALLNEYGQVVGITTIKLMSSSDTVENMGFAIPSTRVVRVVNWLAQGIEIQTPAVGITVYAVTDPLRGMLVDSVSEGGYAAAAGIQPGDIITHAEGEPLYATSDLSQILSSMLVGDTLHLIVNRDGETLEIDVVLSNYDDVHG